MDLVDICSWRLQLCSN